MRHLPVLPPVKPLCCAVTAPLALAAWLCSTAAYAQAVPSTVDPGQMNQRMDRKRTPSAAPQIVIEPDGDKVKAAPGSTEKLFTLKRVSVDGVTVYNESQLAAAYASYVGKEVTFADLQAIARALTAMYRNDGYILSRVVLKPQKVQSGEVELQAHEGYVNQVHFSGEMPADSTLLRAYADRITAERPLNAKTLERYLLLMDDLPGITARGVLNASSAEKGASDLNVKIENKAFEGSLGADNRGNHFVGPYQLTGVAAFNNTLGMFDRTTGRIISDAEFDELLFGDVLHEQQIGTDGDQLTLHAAANRIRPSGRLKSLDIQGNTRLIDIGYAHHYLRSREANLRLDTQFRMQNTKNDILGIEQFEDDIRHVSAGLEFDASDSWKGINQLEASVTQGLDILGASSDGAGRSRVRANHEFTRYNASGSRLQNLTDQAAIFGAFIGQYSQDSLLTSTQFGFGGDAFGRAYDGSELLGDSGLAGSVELRYSITPDDQSLINTYQLYSFYDIGAVWLQEPLVGEQNRESASSAGLGVRFNLMNDMSGSLEFALPLTRDVASEQDRGGRAFFNVIKRF